MPRIPNLRRRGHPAKPRREEDEQGKAPKGPARSYGQSAPMPEHPTAEELATKKPVHPSGRDADIAEREDLEDLTLEPTRENGDDDEKGRGTRDEGRA